MKESHIEDIYRFGFHRADFPPEEMLEGITIVEPVRPPKQMAGGIHTPGMALANVAGNAALLFRVMATSGTFLPGEVYVEPGDVVVVRTAHLDPLQPDLNVLAILTKHIIQRVPDPDEVAEEARDEAALASFAGTQTTEAT